MRKFLIKTIIFFSPLMLIFGCITWVLHISGEFTSVDHVINMQMSGTKTFWGAAYTNQLKYYKLRSTKLIRPEVLAIGTSRVLQIRKEFFRSEVKFFNAGNGIERLRQIKKFVENISPQSKPKLLIICLDQNFFNYNWDNFKVDNYEKELSKSTESVNILIKSWESVITDYFTGKFSFGELMSPTICSTEICIGLNAKINSNYFRPDGTFHYVKYIKQATSSPIDENTEFSVMYKFIENNESYFKHGKDISKDSIKLLKELLKFCKTNNIHVVAFLPPYANGIYEKINEMKDEFSYIFKLKEKLLPIFTEFGYSFFDFTDMDTIGAKRKEYIDGFHASEKAYLRLFIKMVNSDSKLKSYSADIKILEKKLEEAANDYEVFEN